MVGERARRREETCIGQSSPLMETAERVFETTAGVANSYELSESVAKSQ
jgi:hypothetical protein